MFVNGYLKEAFEASMTACADPPCSRLDAIVGMRHLAPPTIPRVFGPSNAPIETYPCSPSGASSAAIADFGCLQDWGPGIMPGPDSSWAQWPHANSSCPGLRECGASSSAQQQQQQQQQTAQSAGSGQPPSPSASTGQLSQEPGADITQHHNAAAPHSRDNSNASPSRQQQHQEQQQPPWLGGLLPGLCQGDAPPNQPSQAGPPPPQQPGSSEVLPSLGDASWLDSFPLPDLFTEADPLALFPDASGEPLLPPLPQGLAPAAALSNCGAAGGSSAGMPQWGTAGQAASLAALLAGSAALDSTAAPPSLLPAAGGLSAAAAAAVATAGGAQARRDTVPQQPELPAKQEECLGGSTRGGSFLPGVPGAAAATAPATGSATLEQQQHSGQQGKGRGRKRSAAAGSGQTRKRGRPRLYDNPTAPDAAAAGPSAPKQDLMQQQQQAQEQEQAEAFQQPQQPAPGKRGRGPKPKYVFESREEAAGARRERNRKAALESYYRHRDHVKGLEEERDRLLAENASLQGLLGHLQAGGPCPLQELSDAGIDAWLGRS